MKKKKLIDEILLIRQTCKAGVTIIDKKQNLKTIEGVYIINDQEIDRLLELASAL